MANGAPASGYVVAPSYDAPSYPAGTAYATPSAPPGAYGSATVAQPGAAVSERGAAAPSQKKARDYHVDLGIGTEAPISVGGVLTAELPHRFLLQLGVGVLPFAYADAIDGFLTSVGAYDAVVSQVVKGSLGNSAVVRASIGGRPFAGHGFEILGGYTLITGGGSVVTSDAVAAILAETGASYQIPQGLSAEIPLSATLHNFHASIGWRWLLADDRLVIRASLSYIQTLASRVDAKVPQSLPELQPYQGLINEQVNSYIGPYLSKYAKAPTLGLSAAVRF